MPIYNITVTCYDPIHHFTIAKNFSIDVTDVNEGPVELTLIPNIVYRYISFHLENLHFLASGKFHHRIYHRAISYHRSGYICSESNI